MMISERLRSIRQEKHLSQADLEQRTGLRRCYISRVENGHTIPSIDTLERLARAMDIRLYQIFYDGEEPPPPPSPLPAAKVPGETWGFEGDSARFLLRLRQLLGHMTEHDRQILLRLASQLTRRSKP
jgi:transcriptional regulator with XRE-family HTH domain